MALDETLAAQLQSEIFKTQGSLSLTDDTPDRNVLERLLRNQLVIMQVLADKNGLDFSGSPEHLRP